MISYQILAEIWVQLEIVTLDVTHAVSVFANNKTSKMQADIFSCKNKNLSQNVEKFLNRLSFRSLRHSKDHLILKEYKISSIL